MGRVHAAGPVSCIAVQRLIVLDADACFFFNLEMADLAEPTMLVGR
jgi:hypothetical protein